LATVPPPFGCRFGAACLAGARGRRPAGGAKHTVPRGIVASTPARRRLAAGWPPVRRLQWTRWVAALGRRVDAAPGRRAGSQSRRRADVPGGSQRRRADAGT